MVIHSFSLSELPECQMPIAMRTDILDQTLAIAMHPAYDCKTAKVSVDLMLNLTQSPETHAFLIRRQGVEKMLEVCEQRQKIINELSPQTQQQRKEDQMMVNVLKYVTLFTICLYHFLFVFLIT